MEYDSPGDTTNADEIFNQNELKIDFATFVFSLSSTALVALGEMQDPIAKETNKNIPVAKQMIDVINMLKEKTKGNLTKEEEELITSLCSELKMKYIKAVDFK